MKPPTLTHTHTHAQKLTLTHSHTHKHTSKTCLSTEREEIGIDKCSLAEQPKKINKAKKETVTNARHKHPKLDGNETLRKKELYNELTIRRKLPIRQSYTLMHRQNVREKFALT